MEFTLTWSAADKRYCASPQPSPDNDQRDYRMLLLSLFGLLLVVLPLAAAGDAWN
jgi:hypothetical protein